MLLTIGAITLAGAILRLAAARGDLWLDEIWSFRLLRDTQAGAGDILFALPRDNNHVLTTLWLAVVGPAAPPLLARLPAVVFGSLCAPMAARALWRRGAVAAAMGAAIFAFDLVFVDLGSQARGYAGMILATLIAFDAVERSLEDAAARRTLGILAAAVAFGAFSHLTMLEAAFALGLSAVPRAMLGWRSRHDGEPTASPPGRAVPIILAIACGVAAPLACLAISVWGGGVHTGLATPFSAGVFGEGAGRLARALMGLPDGPIDGTTAALVLAATVTLCLVLLALVPADRRVFPLVAVIGLPVLHVALRLPNQQYPRFHLTAAIALALLAAEAFAAAWERRHAARAIAIVAAVAVAIGQALTVSTFLVIGRGHYADAATLLSAGGQRTMAVLPTVQAGETAAVIRWYAEPSRSPPRLIAIDCAAPPDWLVVVHLPNESRAAIDAATAGPPLCPARFAIRQVFPAYGLSGFTWVVYTPR